jgi:AcrR family transcriptional regulator
VPEIARAARVATQTVYASAGGKAALFAELLQPAINDPIAFEAMTEARVAEDPERVLELAATAARSGQERYWDIVSGLMRPRPKTNSPSRPSATSRPSAWRRWSSSRNG